MVSKVIEAQELKVGSNLERQLRSGEFVVTAELGPPRGADAEEIRENTRILKGYADAVNVTDCQTAIVRMSSITSCSFVIGEGVEPIAQMTCRDRNRIGIQSDLLGAYALGVRNLLCLTGDHPKFGDHPQARGVFDLDSIQLIRLVKDLRDEGRLFSGDELEVAPKFFIGAAENPFADPLSYRAARLEKKANAGADFIQTQIIYNLERFRAWMEDVRSLGLHRRLHILAGITPPKSAGMAKYMRSKVPGLDVPMEVVERMQEASEPALEGKKIAIELIQAVREIEGVAGIHLMAIGWEKAVPDIVREAGLHPRPVTAS